MRALPFLLALHLACAVPVDDAPLPEEASPSCIEARDHAEAIAIAQKIPMASYGSIEVRPEYVLEP